MSLRFSNARIGIVSGILVNAVALPLVLATLLIQLHCSYSELDEIVRPSFTLETARIKYDATKKQIKIVGPLLKTVSWCVGIWLTVSLIKRLECAVQLFKQRRMETSLLHDECGAFSVIDDEADRITWKGEDPIPHANRITKVCDSEQTKIGDLMSLIKWPGGFSYKNAKEFDLSSAVNCAACDARLRADGVEVVFNAPDGEITIKSHRYPVIDAVGKILDNSRKYTKKGTITATVTKHPKFAQVLIEDTGVGIPKEDAKRIFSFWYRAKVIASKPGCGYGLPSARLTIENVCGGKLELLDSAIGKGSTFRIRLPYRPRRMHLMRRTFSLLMCICQYI